MNLSGRYCESRPAWFFKISHYTVTASAAMLALCFFLGMTANRAAGQANSASLNGVVRDASGAVIPEAQVVLSNTATGVASNSTTNASGVYAFNNIVPGDYSLSVSKDGFSTEIQQGLHILVQQALTQDFQMHPGAVTQSVAVEATTVGLNTENSAIGAVIESQLVTDLPLNGRNFTELLNLNPGVAPANTGQNGGGGQSNPVGSFSAPAIQGAQVRSNYYFLDGIDNTEMNYDIPAVFSTVDDIAEFKVQSHNDEAQFGGVSGGIVNIVTKGGTNRYTGTVWEFLRNTAFDAANPLSLIAEQLVQNQFGVNGGGPLTIPHVYNGKNRSFFFGSYEGFRRAQPAAAATYWVPTTAELGGDFSNICTAGFNSSGVCNNPKQQLYNPFTTLTNSAGVTTRQPFANNNISSVLNAPAVTYAKAYFPAALPTQLTKSGVPYNGINPAHVLTNMNTWSVRGDETINSRNTAFFRITNQLQTSNPLASTTNYTQERKVNGQQYAVGYVHTFGASSALDGEFGHDELTNGEITRINGGNAQSIVQSAGIANSLACNFSGGYSPCVLPSLSFQSDGTGIAGGGEGESTTLLSNVYQYRANFTQAFRRHSFSMGINWESDYFHVINTSNSITFSDQSVQDPTNTSYGGPNYGSLAAYLMGVSTQGGLRDTVAPLNGQKAVGFYFMDKWKYSDKLTVNLGLRYDAQINGIYGSTNGGTIYVGDMDLQFGPQAKGDPWAGSYVLQKQPASCSATNNTAPCIPGGSLASVIAYANANPVYPGVVTPANAIQVAGDGHVFKPNYNGWQPRIGVAYRLDNQTVLRGGFGLFYDMWGGISQSIQNIGGTWPTTGQITSSPINGPNTVAVVNWQNPIASGSQGSANLPAPTPFNNQQFYRQPDAKNPYSEQWNLGLERDMGHKTIISANYVGSESHRLVVGGMYNVALYAAAGTPAEVNARDPFPYENNTYYDRSIGNTGYHALELSANHQASNGIGYLVSYTWSRNINNACDDFFGAGCSTPNPYDLSHDRAAAGTNVPQVLTAAFNAKSPFGKNQMFSTHSAIGDYIVGNWALTGIVTFTSGLNYNISESGNAANTWAPGGSGYNRPDQVGSPSLSNRSIHEWFNTSAYQFTAPYTFGDTPRNSLRGQPYKNADLALLRSFPIGESRSLQFRVDAFNIFNHPTFANPDSRLGDSTFGTVLSNGGPLGSGTRSVERQLQFALKLHY
jgi:Carboxypeptidase regulatory-like domain/TonB dependent receptor